MSARMDEERALERLAEADAALAEGRFEDALGLARTLDVRFAGRWLVEAEAWSQLGVNEDAEAALERARDLLGDDDPDVLWTEGCLRLAEWRTDEARAAFERLDALEPSPAACAQLALLRDLAGDARGADELMRRANQLEPDHYPAVPRLDPDAFEAVVDEAAAELPEEFRRAFETVAVVIDPMPTAAVVGAPESGHPPDLLGLYVGAALGETSAFDAPALPPTIFLFQRNLERSAADLATLRHEIAVTLWHELGHALGFDEEGVDGMGLG